MMLPSSASIRKVKKNYAQIAYISAVGVAGACGHKGTLPVELEGTG